MERFEVVDRGHISQPEWDTVVEASSTCGPWTFWDWQEIVEGVPRWELCDIGFGVRDHHNRLVCVAPLHHIAAENRVSCCGFGLTTPAVSGGIQAGEQRRLLSMAFAEMVRRGERVGATILDVGLDPLCEMSRQSLRGVNPLVEFGVSDRSSHTLVLDLSMSEADLRRQISQDARQQIRRAEAEGYVARRVAWPEMIDEYYRVHVETYQRTGVLPHPREYFSGISRYRGRNGRAVLWAGLSRKGRVVAFHNDARAPGSSYYHTGCCETGALRSGINYLLFWAAILGAKEDGCSWYEIGEVFPAATDGKERGLTVFKSKFGGELRRSFRGSMALQRLDTPVITPARTTKLAVREWVRATRVLFATVAGEKAAKLARTAILRSALARPSAERMKSDADPELRRSIRREYESGRTYPSVRICAQVNENSPQYADRLLTEKIETVYRHRQPGLLVDLCCATGDHLFAIAGPSEYAVGIDFSSTYVAEARRKSADHADRANCEFVCGDARELPLPSNTVATLYSFSAMYAIPKVEEVIGEIARVLQPGGRCVLDFGNSRSLNRLAVLFGYPELPPTFPFPLPRLLEACRSAGLVVLEHRSFQILPLWATKPWWLGPFLHPFWTRLLARRAGSRMLDEHISSLPGVRQFAFRHLVVCGKA